MSPRSSASAKTKRKRKVKPKAKRIRRPTCICGHVIDLHNRRRPKYSPYETSKRCLGKGFKRLPINKEGLLAFADKYLRMNGNRTPNKKAIELTAAQVQVYMRLKTCSCTKFKERP